MFIKEIVDRMKSIICLDCDNVESGDEPWYGFDCGDKFTPYRCKDCLSENIRFASDIRYQEQGQWVEDKYRDQLEKPDYNHKFDIAFTVISQKEDPYKVLPSELRAALITRIAEIDVEKGWEEAVGFCDSYEVVKKND
tara:strand:- start:596 stop:1009 length:414 start_codon:yes stop_codon:yes gene_type:complete